jgi:hypothetical protein
LLGRYFTDTVAGAAVGGGTVCALALILDLAWPWQRRAPVIVDRFAGQSMEKDPR